MLKTVRRNSLSEGVRNATGRLLVHSKPQCTRGALRNKKTGRSQQTTRTRVRGATGSTHTKAEEG